MPKKSHICKYLICRKSKPPYFNTNLGFYLLHHQKLWQKTWIIAFKLIIPVPPSWKDKPSSQEVTLGQRLELPCTADGAPQPKITWKKEIGMYTIQKNFPIWISRHSFFQATRWSMAYFGESFKIVSLWSTGRCNLRRFGQNKSSFSTYREGRFHSILKILNSEYTGINQFHEIFSPPICKL